MNHFHVDEDITKAETLPAAFYRDDEVFEQLKNRVFGRSYQWFGAIDDLLPQESYVKPLMFIEGFLEEPFFLRKDMQMASPAFQMCVPIVETSSFIMRVFQNELLVVTMEEPGKQMGASSLCQNLKRPKIFQEPVTI